MSTQNCCTRVSDTDDGTGVVLWLFYTDVRGVECMRTIRTADLAERALALLLKLKIDAALVIPNTTPRQVVGGVDVEMRLWWFDSDVFKQAMCPFCPLFVEDVWCQPIDPDFLGKPAMIGDVPSCGSCYTHACSEFGGFERYLRLLREAKQEAAR